MTLDQLRIFVEVARKRHVTRAAVNLNLTQSTVSAAIKALEERHAVVLFDRIGRGISLTSEGRAFLVQADLVLAAAHQAERLLRDLSGGEAGQIAVYASQTVSSTWLPQRLVRFHETYLAIEIALHVANTTLCLEALRSGEADIAFTEATVDDPQLIQKHVGQDQLCLVTGSRHSWVETPPEGLPDLLASRWVLREAGSGTRSTFEDFLRKGGLDPTKLDVFLELPSNEAVCAAVADSASATVISYDVAQPYLMTGRMVSLPLDLPTRPFHLVRHRGRHPSHASTLLEQSISSFR